jgi:transcription elongation factor Elf1
MADKEREYKSLAELRDEALKLHDGIKCPKCHCRQFHVTQTRYTNKFYRRRRTCRNCGHSISTVEIPIDTGKHF